MTTKSTETAAAELRHKLAASGIVAFLGAYDVFSATLVGKHFDAVFCSGYGLSASHYGLPDAGYISASDVISFAARVRAVLPKKHILVDIDDGFGDADVACDVIKRLEIGGASAIMMEDQKRPKKCGHLDGKIVVPVQEYVARLAQVLRFRASMFVLARTDTNDPNDGITRAREYADVGADAVMVEAIRDMASLERLRAAIPDDVAIAVNLILGGKTPVEATLTQLASAGANIAIYSTPCLYAAHAAVQSAVEELAMTDGLLGGTVPSVNLEENDGHLREVAKARFAP